MNSLEEQLVVSLAAGRTCVIVKPNARHNELLGFDANKTAFRIAVKAAPEKGEANRELARFVSKIAKARVQIVSGLTSKTKILQISK